MENRNNSMTTKAIVHRLFISLTIIGGCLLFSLYLFDVLKFSFIENPKVKILISSVLLSAIFIYLVTKYGYYLKNGSVRFDWKAFILLSFISEVIGYWWIGTPFGYILTSFGFIFLIIGLAILYKQKPRRLD